MKVITGGKAALSCFVVTQLKIPVFLLLQPEKQQTFVQSLYLVSLLAALHAPQQVVTGE